MSFLLHAIVFYLVIPALAVALICLGADWLITRRPAGEILGGWWKWLTDRIYSLRARGDADVIQGIPVPAAAAPSPAASAPTPPPPPPPGATAAMIAPAAPLSAVAEIPAAAGSDLMYAVDALITTASSGDIKDVRRVITTLAAANEGTGLAIRRLSQRLAEPDKDYGSEVWEPLGAAADLLVAAAMNCGEADAMLVALLNTTVGELAGSAMRAPHSSQMNGGA